MKNETWEWGIRRMSTEEWEIWNETKEWNEEDWEIYN